MLNYDQTKEIRDAAHGWIDFAAMYYGEAINLDHVRFDLKGKAAGQAIKNGDWYEIRVNPEIAAQNWEEYLNQTIPHEVAHIVQYQIYPYCGGHGRAWKGIMRVFGKDPKRCHDYDLTNVTVRRQRRIRYECEPGCEHMLTMTRHNKIQRKGDKYRCNKTGKRLYLALDNEPARCA